MIEAAMIWNEPNNLSHWDREIDPEWELFSRMAYLAGEAIYAENPKITRVMGGISPIDPNFVTCLRDKRALEHVDAIGVHGFPLDWNHWQIDEWPDKLAEVRSVTDLPIWITEVGVSTFGAEEVQEFGLRRTAELLSSKCDRIHWYSLLDLPRVWPATTRHREVMNYRIWMIITAGALAACGSANRSANSQEDGSNQMGVGGSSGKSDNMPPTTPLSEPNALPPGPPTALSSSPASPASPASPTPP